MLQELLDDNAFLSVTITSEEFSPINVMKGILERRVFSTYYSTCRIPLSQKSEGHDS